MAVNTTLSWSRTEASCALSALRDDELALILLARQPGMTYREVARITGLAPGEVLERLRTGLGRLRQAMPASVGAHR